MKHRPMTPQDSPDDLPPLSHLHQRAKDLLRDVGGDLSAMSLEEARSTLHRLAVRHVELEYRHEELRKAHIELTHSRDEYAELYDHAPIGCLTLDSHGTILDANLTAARMFGVERQHLLQSKLSDYVDPADQARYSVHRQSVFSSGEIQSTDIQFVPSHGASLTARLDCFAFGSESDRCCHTALTDITQQKAVAESLQQLNDTLEQRITEQTHEIRLLAAAVSHLGEGILITDDSLEWPGPTILFVNDALCDITGYSADELLGQSPRILHGANTDRATLDRIKQDLVTGRSSAAEVVNYRKDGSWYIADLFITPLFDARGQHTNFVSIHRDVTERRQTLVALRDREERLRSLVNAATDSIITINRQGSITDVNPATTVMFGYTEEELVGHNIKMLMPPPYCDEHDDYIQRYLSTGVPRVIGIGRDAIARRKDHSLFPVSLAINDIEHLGLFTGIIRDITEHRQLQRDILQAADLEQRRIGQDLHDSTQQELAGLAMLTQDLIDNLNCESSPSAAGPREKHCDLAKRILEGIDRVLREVQVISKGLIPGKLGRDGLCHALRDLAFRTDTLDHITCAFKCEQPVEFEDEFTATHLFRIAQEALTNSLKHSQAEHILIALDSSEGRVVLQVADDGIGMNATQSSPGLGLQNMFYRASLIGAQLMVDPVESGGTLVTCKLIGEGVH